MKNETRAAVYDSGLHLETCHFRGVAQPFPCHFHAYYVLGLVEKGRRTLLCRGREYALQAGDLVLFHPGDDHACVQCAGELLDYRSFHIAKETMLALHGEITGKWELPGFSRTVLRSGEAACIFRRLHTLVMARTTARLEKEEALFLLLTLLLRRYGQPFSEVVPEYREEIGKACRFMEHHLDQRLGLDDLCRCTGLSRSTLLRAFTRETGVTPYRYLESLRIGRARQLLEQGASPVDAALQTGFSDQSHFTNAFSRFIGLTPGLYRCIYSVPAEQDAAASRRGRP